MAAPLSAAALEGLTLNPNFDSVGKEFVQHYYQSFATNRSALKDLYGASSMLTWEEKQYQGADAIIAGLTQLTFTKVTHIITRADCQPTGNNGILVFVTGDIKIDEEPPLKFSQVFHLTPTATGGYLIFNDLFRLNIG